MIEITVHSKNGDCIALADDEDEELLNRHWRLRKGYATTRIYAGKRNGHSVQREVSMHRMVLGASIPEGKETDHINRDKLDNRRSNLRPVTKLQNCQNLSAQKRNRTGLRGVQWDKANGLYKACARLNGVLHSFGYFTDPVEASAVVSAWRAKNMPYAVEGG